MESSLKTIIQILGSLFSEMYPDRENNENIVSLIRCASTMQIELV